MRRSSPIGDVSSPLVPSNHSPEVSSVLPPIVSTPHAPIRSSEDRLRTAGSCRGFSGSTADSSLVLYHWTISKRKRILGMRVTSADSAYAYQ
jgi:hypothetical protein